MKRLTLLSLMLAFSVTLFAQRGKVTSALSYKESGDLAKAMQTIEETIDTSNVKAEKSIGWPRTWEVRGEIYQEIHRKGIKNLAKNPLFIAFDSYMKAVELDEPGRFSKSLMVKFTFMQTDLTNLAIQSFEKEDFETSLESFEKFLKISNISFMKPKPDVVVVDTAIIYNTGLAAYKAKNWDKAIEYFNQSIKNNYNGDVCYNFIYQAYQELGDTLSSINALKEGFRAYPDSETLVVQLINFYISQDKAEDAVQYIDMAIKENPGNSSYYTAKGSMLEKLGRPEAAVEMYKKALEVDPKQFTPYYNLSVIYYNRGVETMNEANKLPANQNDKYEAEMKKSMDHFRESLPYIEKAYELDSTEIAIMESLRTIYYRLQMNDKFQEINEKIQKLKQ